MKKIILLFTILLTGNLWSQKNYSISGIIKDASSGETLIGVTITSNNVTAYSNEYGYYALSLPEGNHELNFSYPSYQTIEKTINLKENSKIDIKMVGTTRVLNTVVVTSKKERTPIKKAEMSVNKMSVETAKKIPAILGEVDILKSITTLPGVTTAGEGQSGFNVRGGAADQNLVLLDEATLFNTSHLFGLFSVVNADAIKDLKLYKGGIPAMYGGRIASVLDLRQKDGNNQNFHANGGIGLISSRLSLEGPLKKDKSSFFISGRRSYADIFIPLFLPDNENKAYFYDLNTKVNFEINDKNKLYASGYFGRDVFSLSSSFINTYGNAVGNLRWNHIFNKELFSNLSLIYSDYNYGLELDFVGFQWKSGLKNLNIKYDLKKINKNLQFNYGIGTIAHEFNPGKIEPNNADSNIATDQLAKKYAVESGVYVDIEHKVNNKIDLRYGLRLANFLNMGQDDFNIYNGDPITYNADLKIYESANPIEKRDYKRSDILQSYNSLEPRFSIAYAFNKKQSIKASYQRISQFLHLISNTQSPSPLDIWTPSDQYIKPQLSDQIAFGYQQDFNNTYSLTTEIFGKTVQNRLDYIDGAELIAQEAIESVVLAGTSRAYGLELMFKKDLGDLTGWLSYTLSRSEQQTPGRNATEIGINNGKWYATGYDKTHDLTLIANYAKTKKWSFNGNFTLKTGQPVTYPLGNYQFLDMQIPDYGDRNAFRLPVYHRLDLSATYVPSKNENRKFKTDWVFSIYNVYNRKNVSSIVYGQNFETGQNKTEYLSIFGMLPSITYNFKF